MYRYMDSHPHQGNQMPFPQNHCPTCSAAPPQMGYEWRPYSGNYGHQMPVQYHTCCNHNCFPGYYGFPPYYQMAPPLPFHWHGCRPMYPEPYPVHYAPAPYYSMEHPRPEYAKNDSDNCGFPNHGFSKKGGNNVQIEEHEGGDGRKEKESLVPAGLKDYPYPIVWIPPEYMKNGENRAPLEQDKRELSENRPQLHDAMSPKSLDKYSGWEPGVWNLWFPPDSNGLRSLKQGGEGKKSQNSEEKNAYFPYPIIWMPQFEKKEEAEGKEHKQKSSSSKPTEEQNLSFKIIPVKPLEVADGGNKSRASEENSGAKGVLNNVEKAADQRYIPVKEGEAHREDNTSQNTEGKREDNVSKHGENGGKKKPSDGCNGQSSKLPPVCLRVDPLPRKKNGNGSSRSPSPPGQRGKLQETSNDATNGSSPTERLKGSQETTTNKSHGPEQKKKEIRVVDVVEQAAGQNVDKDSPRESRNEIPSQDQPPMKSPTDPCTKMSDDHPLEKPGVAAGDCQAKTDGGSIAEGKTFEEAIEEQKAMVNSQSVNPECKAGEDKAGSEVEEKKSDEVPKAEKRNLSDSEAAVIIQAAYRGFEVRKWEPLKKLKQLAKVREEVDEIRNGIQALESLSNLQRDNRQKVIIGETIMRLLLKLDAIQGLHPNLRDIRKSLARELVSLQEKLDSIMNQKPEAPVVEEPTAKDKKEAKEATEGLQLNSPADHFDETPSVTGPSEIPAEEDMSVKSQGENISIPMSAEENVTIGAEVKSNVEQQHAVDMGPVLELKDEQDYGKNLEASQVMSSETSPDPGLEGNAALPLVTGECTNEMGVAECLLGDTMNDSNAADKIEVAEVVDTTQSINEGHIEMNELAELPLGIIEEDTAMNVVPESKKDDMIEADGNTVQEGDQIGCNNTSDVTTIADYEAKDMNEPEQQPQPVDENPEIHEPQASVSQPAVSEPKNDDNTESREAKASEGNPVECDENLVEAVSEDSAMAGLQKEEALQTEKVPIEEAPEEMFDPQEADFAIAISYNPKGSETPETESAEGDSSKQVVIQEKGKEPDDENEKLIEENKKLREMMEQLVNAGKEQLTAISNLTGRVKDLERKLSRKKKLRTRRHRAAAPLPASVRPPLPASVRP